MIRLLAGVFLALLLTGCGLSTRQAQNVADGLAGIDAARPRVVDPIAGPALDGARDHIEAVAEGHPIPPPRRSPAAIAAEPDAYCAEAQRAVAEARASVPWWGWLAGAVAGVVGLARFLPGPGGAIAEAAWRILAPRQVVVADHRSTVQVRGFRDLVGLIEGLPNTATLTQLKGRITTKAASDVRDAIGQHLANAGPPGT